MAEKLTTRVTFKLKSQRGASFSVALLLFLVCVVVSSIVLAASTASAGQFADQGKADQRYYSVTSAAQLFQDALDGSVPDGVKKGETGTLTYTLVEHREGTNTIARSQSGDAVKTLAEDKGKASVNFNAPTPQGLDFLKNATAYALSGVAAGQIDQTLTEKLKGLNWGESCVPKSSSGDDSATSQLLAQESTATFEITPTIPGVDTSTGEYKVYAQAALNSDWTIDLYFCNRSLDSLDDDESKDERTYLYMKLAAAVSEDVATSETLQGSTTADEAGGTLNTEKVSWDKTTTITWSIERVVPGRGPANAS